MVVYHQCRNCGFRFAKKFKFSYYCSELCKEQWKEMIKERHKKYIIEAEDEIENGFNKDKKK